jgi:cysteine synthase A
LLQEVDFSCRTVQQSASPEMHRKTTAVEMLKQFKRIDGFVAGVGTGGTITGVGEVLKDKMKGVRICAVEPAASPVISGGEPGFHKIQGIGAGFIPAVLNRQIIDEVMTVTDEDATTYTRRLAAEEELLVGISSRRRLLRGVKAGEDSRRRTCCRDRFRRQGDTI